MTGKLKFRLANAALGAIVTHALVNKEGTYIVAAESGTSASRTDGRRDRMRTDKVFFRSRFTPDNGPAHQGRAEDFK